MRKCFLFLLVCSGSLLGGLNQTDDLTAIQPGEKLPFEVHVELADFSLPNGIHSYAQAVYNGKWILLAGRTNGMHGFNFTGNFPPPAQNTVVYVIDPIAKTVFSRDLMDPASGLVQAQIDLLSVTSPQSYQRNHTLYITGGYGVETATGLFSTKPYLSAIDIPGLIQWVTHPSSQETAVKHIRFLFDPIFQITGGYMARGEGDTTLLIFGQNFTGQYTPGSNGKYSRQVRRFNIHDDGEHLSIKVKKSSPQFPNPHYRRRDLNIVPFVRDLLGECVPCFAVLSGVFTEAGGIWTVPVMVNINGQTEMDNPQDPTTFKQGMNNYTCPTLNMFSGHFGSMYVVLFGGLSFGYFDDAGFQTDPEIPFINQITTIQYDQTATFKQFLMPAEYPVIPSTFSNPGNPLLFGAGAAFFPVVNLPAYDNDVIKLDHLSKEPFTIGYIVGGIASTVPNTESVSDSGASPYIFSVTLHRK